MFPDKTRNVYYYCCRRQTPILDTLHSLAPVLSPELYIVKMLILRRMSLQNIRESGGIYYAQKMFVNFEGEVNNLKLYFVLRVAHVEFLQSESSDANDRQIYFE